MARFTEQNENRPMTYFDCVRMCTKLADTANAELAPYIKRKSIFDGASVYPIWERTYDVGEVADGILGLSFNDVTLEKGVYSPDEVRGIAAALVRVADMLDGMSVSVETTTVLS